METGDLRQAKINGRGPLGNSYYLHNTTTTTATGSGTGRLLSRADVVQEMNECSCAGHEASFNRSLAPANIAISPVLSRHKQNKDDDRIDVSSGLAEPYGEEYSIVTDAFVTGSPTVASFAVGFSCPRPNRRGPATCECLIDPASSRTILSGAKSSVQMGQLQDIIRSMLG